MNDGSGGGNVLVASIGTNTTTYTFSDLSPGLSYSFHVTMQLEPRFVRRFASTDGDPCSVNTTNATATNSSSTNSSSTNTTPCESVNSRRRLAADVGPTEGPPSSAVVVVTADAANVIVFPGLSGTADPGAFCGARVHFDLTGFYTWNRPLRKRSHNRVLVSARRYRHMAWYGVAVYKL